MYYLFVELYQIRYLLNAPSQKSILYWTQVENGLSEAVHLTWLLVNRVHILVHQLQSEVVSRLVANVQRAAGASGLLLQAVAARCQPCLKVLSLTAT
jgi:hypothetical protein